MPSIFDQFTTSRPGSAKRTRRSEKEKPSNSPTVVNTATITTLTPVTLNPPPSSANESAQRSTLLSKDARSCPTLPLAEDDDMMRPIRRGSMPVAKSELPLLNFGNLHSHCAVQEEVRTARRRIEDIGRTLSKLRPYLYIGAECATKDTSALKRAGITHIVDLAGKSNGGTVEGFVYLKLFCRDDANEDLRGIIHVVSAFVDGARANGGNVLVHCKQGVSRSVSVSIAYVMLREGVALDDLMAEMRKVRPIACPNSGFWDILREIEAGMRYGQRRNRVFVLRRGEDGVLKPVGVRRRKVDSAECYVLHRGNRHGVVAWRGRNAGERLWKICAEFAKRVAEQERLDQQLFGGGWGGCKVVREGEESAVDEELVRVLMV